ncbi:uncharacterized protein C8orf76 homolog isoform X2 [Serinus canaria]|uniref:uncharacterized protein C8orf76 homolog isoform X2 n=1 Tax=Serinus canaria TaxID=9135 RepID=UPI0021CCE603|nr:uncharacterized protein C8orf76 homolog isoform X2 [Serinus canaria]
MGKLPKHIPTHSMHNHQDEMLTEYRHNYAVDLPRRGTAVELVAGSTSLSASGDRAPPPKPSGAGGSGRGGGDGAGAGLGVRGFPWFHSAADAGEGAAAITSSKFRADWAFRQRDFEKALCEYSDCLLLLPASNIAMRRDVQEGQARCLSHLGRHKEALDIAEKMGLENVEKKMMCLQQLICLHPFNPWFWKLLAEAYMSLLQNLSPLVIPKANLNQSEEICVSDSSLKTSTGREINQQPHTSEGQKEGPWFSLTAETKGENAVTCPSSQVMKEFPCTSGELERMDKEKCADSKAWKKSMLKKVGIKACASFTRARLLLQLTQSQQLSFVLENNRKCQKEIDDKVALLGFDENSLLLMTKAMGQDLTPEKLKEEFQCEVKCIGPSALSSLVTASVMEFEIKWFGNLQDDLCHFDGQFYSDIYLPPSVT